MSLLTNYIFSKNETGIIYNFWVESSDWSVLPINNEADFLTYLESYGATDVVINDFSLVNDGALKCNVTCNGLTELNFSSLEDANVVFLGNDICIDLVGLVIVYTPNVVFNPTYLSNTITSINLGYSDIDNFNPICDLSSVIDIRLQGNSIPIDGWNDDTEWISTLPNSGNLNLYDGLNSIVGTNSETLLLAKGWTIDT